MTRSKQQVLLDGTPSAGALFNEDRTYRYKLWRTWDPTKPVCAFIMLNPSTADEFVLDPTVRRCMSFAKAWNYGSLQVGNIFALRSTDPEALYSHPDPVGPENNFWLGEINRTSDMTVAAWGTHGTFQDRSHEVLGFLSGLYHLGQNRDGTPKHPLYLSRTLKLNLMEVLK
jgi:hypothetical protein